MNERYAIYFSPEQGDPLEGFGSRRIGRSAFTGKKVPQYEIHGLASAELAKITEEPRYYGFHATLRAPFCLNGRKTGTEFVGAVRDLAAKRAPFVCPNLRLSRMGDFLALTLDEPCGKMKGLAYDCVRCCDEFSLPADKEELTRRRMKGLAYRQELHLLQWGHPYIFQDYVFHLSLTGRLKTDEQVTAMHTVLASIAGEFTEQPLPIEAIYIFHQADRCKPFNVMQRIQLGG